MKVEWPILAIFLTYLDSCSPLGDEIWTVEMFLSLVKSKDIHQVDAFVCNMKDGVRIMKYVNHSDKQAEYLVAVRILKKWTPKEILYTKIGVFIDLSCQENRRLFKESKKEWFKLNYSWFIWDTEAYFALPSSNPLSFYSDVIVATNYTFYQVTKYVDNAPTEQTNIGNWDSSNGEFNITTLAIKPNLYRNIIVGSYFAVQDIYDKKNVSQQLLDPTFKHGYDSGNRFFYSVSLDVSDIYNFRGNANYFSMDLIDADEWGIKANGSWTGVVGQLQRGIADVGLTPLLPISQRLEVTHALPVLQKYWFALIFKQPRALGTYKALILELAPFVWVLVLLLIAVGGLVFSLTQKTEVKYGGSLDEGMVLSIGIFANQGLSVLPGGTSSRIVCLSLMMAGLLVSNYYNAATMTALLSEAPPTIKTFDHYLKSDIPLNLINATYMTSTYGKNKVFHPKAWSKVALDSKVVNMKDGLQAIRKGEAFCAEYYILFEGIDTNFKDEEKCSLTVFSVNVVYTGMRFIKQDKHLLEMLSRGLIKTLEYGIAIKKRNDWIKGPPSCFRAVPFIHVRLESVSVAFGIFAIGVLLSATMFVGEIMYYKKSPKWRD